MRRRSPARSSSLRLALAICGVFTAAAVLAGSLAYALQSASAAARFSEEVRQDADSLLATLQRGGPAELREQVEANTAGGGHGADLVAFVDPATGLQSGNFLPHALVPGGRRLRPGTDFAFQGPAPDDPAASYFAYGIATPQGWIFAAHDDAVLQANNAILIASLTGGLGLASLGSIGFAVWIARRNDARIARMEAVLEAVGHGAHGLRIAELGDDDLGRLARQVDATLARLQAGIESIRQVSTDIAHDLRSPLARLRLRLEPLALERELAAQHREEVGRALADLDGIAGTFDAILRLSRLQADAVPLQRVPVDSGALLMELAELLEPVCEELGHRLTLDLTAQPPMLNADPALLRQALLNLLDNAMAHCPAPARIVLGARKAGDGGMRLWVADDGPGIPAADRQRVRERFVRLDASRHRPGSGLGLALVEAIAARHGAALHLHDAAPGLRAELHFPPPARPDLTEP